MTAKKFFSRASWVILTILLFPAGAVQASKNAVPGDSIYPVKLILEDAVLLMMKSSNSATSDMEMKFTKRRLLEVEQVADTVFVVDSLKSLNNQVADTTLSIEKVENLEKQSELVNTYLQTLRQTQTSLDQQKSVLNTKTSPANYNYTNNQLVNNYYYTTPSNSNNAAPTKTNSNNTAPTNTNSNTTAPTNTNSNTTAPTNTAPITTNSKNTVPTNTNSNNAATNNVGSSTQTQTAPPPQEIRIAIEKTQADIKEEIKKLEEVAVNNALQQQQRAADKNKKQQEEKKDKEDEKKNNKGNRDHDDD